MKTLHLDYAAGTPVAPAVAERMAEILRSPELIANPSSSHALGRRAAEAVEAARAQLAGCIGAEPGEIVWTSGATEASNLAIKGAMAFYRERGRHLVTSRIEHRSVLDACRALTEDGVSVSYADVNASGHVDADAVAAAIRPDTVLVSIMWVNNETGAINDIASIAELTRSRSVLLHVDAAQALGRVPIDLRQLPIDLLSLTAQKAYGPRGAGALFVRRRPRARLTPLLHGGGHEQGMRSGTLSLHQVAGFALAAELTVTGRAAEQARLATLRDRFEAELLSLGGVHRNGGEPRASAFSNLRFDGVHGESLKALLGPICASGGSACSSATAEPSYVLRALGLDDRLAGASLRFSFGADSDDAVVDQAVGILAAAIRRLRRCAGVAQAPAAAPSVPCAPGVPMPVWERMTTGSRLGGAASCDRCVSVASAAHQISVTLGVNASDGRIVDARADAIGCPFTLACADWACEQLIGQPIDASACDTERMIADLEIPELRRHCVMVMEDAIQELARGAVSSAPA